MEITSAFENAAIGMAVISPDSRNLRVNQALAQMLGYSRDEMLARSMHEVTHPDDVGHDLEQRDLCLAGKQDTCRHEKRYLRRDGSIVWANLTCTLVRNPDGSPLHFISQVQDITERKLAEQALRRSEERFRSLAMLSSDWYWEQDEQFRFTAFSGPKRTGLSRPSMGIVLMSRRWEANGAQPLHSTWEAHRALLQAHQPFFDFQYMRAVEGEPTRYLSTSGEPVFDEEGRFRGYRGTARDITPDKLAEQRLRETQAMLAMAAQIGRLGAWAWEVGQERVYWSPEVCAIHDVKADFAPTAAELFAFYAPEYRQTMCATIRACVNDGTPYDVETQVLTAKGRRIWVRIIAEAEWDAQGKVRRLQGACQDITESKRAAEEARLMAEQLTGTVLRLNAELEARVKDRTAQLELANKELQAFSYSIAHDLRAPLSSIDGFSKMLEQAAGSDLPQPAGHYLSRIRAGVRQMGELTDGLLALASLSRGELHGEVVDLAVLARAAVDACRERSPQRVVDVEIAPGLPVRGDPRLLAQVMGNLVSNAWKFTAKKDRARIEIGSMPGADGSQVHFVRDNGAGFDMAHASRMFDAFQRLHSLAEFEGTGIGLAIVHRVVARHGGRIWADAAPQQGATFFFTLGHAAG
ncbi:MAG TPA: PAS domain S-box protein [Ramlibacter sp.]|nr:PAS domain S-box protein [Ramlibacter sp.]